MILKRIKNKMENLFFKGTRNRIRKEEAAKSAERMRRLADSGTREANRMYQKGLKEGEANALKNAKNNANGNGDGSILDSIKNTWNKAGTAGKVGMGAGAVAGTYLLGKGAAATLSGNND
jgi:hypothetical protein